MGGTLEGLNGSRLQRVAPRRVYVVEGVDPSARLPGAHGPERTVVGGVAERNIGIDVGLRAGVKVGQVLPTVVDVVLVVVHSASEFVVVDAALGRVPGELDGN